MPPNPIPIIKAPIVYTKKTYQLRRVPYSSLNIPARRPFIDCLNLSCKNLAGPPEGPAAKLLLVVLGQVGGL